MRWDAETARSHLVAARVARLATVGADGQPHLVPIVFAVSAADVLYFAVDDVKAKASMQLKRLANIAANPRVSVLTDHYDDDWTQLWWARGDGTARLAAQPEAGEALALLAARYSQYRAAPPPGPVVAVEVCRWSGWAAGDATRPSGRGSAGPGPD